jgi:hypothetical protein
LILWTKSWSPHLSTQPSSFGTSLGGSFRRPIGAPIRLRILCTTDLMIWQPFLRLILLYRLWMRDRVWRKWENSRRQRTIRSQTFASPSLTLNGSSAHPLINASESGTSLLAFS